jgi:hypothetical protein
MRKIRYDTEAFDFYTEMQKALNVYDLSLIGAVSDVFTIETEQRSAYHKLWYKYVDDNYDYVINDLYTNLVLHYVVDLFNGEPLLYQTKPTVRFHLPGNHAVSNFHKDSQYNHNREEVNFFMPLTPAYGNNTIWIESEEDKGDFRPMEADYGELAVFEGGKLLHGNHINDTGRARVSFDFRVLKKKNYVADDTKVSRVQGRKFLIGDYWQEVQY